MRSQTGLVKVSDFKTERELESVTSCSKHENVHGANEDCPANDPVENYESSPSISPPQTCSNWFAGDDGTSLLMADLSELMLYLS